MTTKRPILNLTPLQRHALRRFADQAFHDCTLAAIASDAGIKAPSIYAHFKNKEELYMSLLPPAIDYELRLTRRALSDGKPETLWTFLKGIGDRFRRTSHLRFLVRASYLPPAGLAGEIHALVTPFTLRQTEILTDCFHLLPPVRVPPDVLAAAYQGLVDSLQAAILYIGKKEFENRLKALWAVFSIGLEEKSE